MTSYTFRPAKRENVTLLIGIAGASGSGKTYSAMSMAKGICGDEPFAVIDTENGRASHYADYFRFDVLDLQPPFRPDAYAQAIAAADAQGYKAIVVDSMSHEYAGDGGILDWQDEEFQRMGAREAVKMAAWIKPKMAHKQMVQSMLRTKAHLILCFRAEPKVEMKKDDKGKMVIVPKETLTGLDGWVPLTEKNLPFELTASFLMVPDHPGYPRPIKLQEQHRELFPLDRPINSESGRLVAAWAAGEPADKPTPKPTKEPFNAEKALSAFAAYGVTGEQVAQRLGHAVSEGDRRQLGEWHRALVDGQPWPDQAPDEGGGAVPDPAPRQERAKAARGGF